MYKKNYYKIVENKRLNDNVFLMKLEGDTTYITASGQFINISVDNCYLRRPISVCDYDDTSITIIYKVVGKGTEIMSKMPLGKILDVLTGLGNGFDTSVSGEKPLLIGGGVGVPPMYRLAKDLITLGKKPTVILGFNTMSELFFVKEFDKLGVNVIVTTADGSFGKKGFVTAGMDIDYTYTYACGPLPMLKAVYDKSYTSGQYSFEERMGCGFGGCMGCTCKTKYGNKRICIDGPVLVKEEIIW